MDMLGYPNRNADRYMLAKVCQQTVELERPMLSVCRFEWKRESPWKVKRIQQQNICSYLECGMRLDVFFTADEDFLGNRAAH
jgi:hypothetical protein